MLKVYIRDDEVQVSLVTAPMGERHVQLRSIANVPFESLEISGECVEIFWIFHSSIEVVDLVLIVDAIRRCSRNCDIVLNMPYVPFCRQDRVCKFGESLSLSAFAEIINMLGFARVNYVDGHSYATGIAIKNSVDNYHRVLNSKRAEILKDFPVNETVIIIPDAGAMKRATLFMEKFGYKLAIQCLKRRNIDGGIDEVSLLTFKEVSYEKFSKALIVDDIFDGGATFTHIADAVCSNEKTAHLAVNVLITHGGFTNKNVFKSSNIKGVKALFNYCTDGDWLAKMKEEGFLL